MRNVHLITGVSVLLVMSLVVGCSHASNTTDAKTPVTYEQPQQSLPQAIANKLSSYSNRKVTRNTLPLTTAITEAGGTSTLSGDNVLYITPQQVYAIRQFGAVWNMLQTKPVVVWVHTTATIAAKEWKSGGYQSDPLPSPKTYYTQDLIPTPDAYHKAQSGWIELPGVLQVKEQTKWLGFFQGH